MPRATCLSYPLTACLMNYFQRWAYPSVFLTFSLSYIGRSFPDPVIPTSIDGCPL